MRTVCRSIAGHTISRSGWPTSPDLEDGAACCPVAGKIEKTRTCHSGAPRAPRGGWWPGHAKEDPEGPSSVPLPRLDSNQ
ncbi:hypothetical protein EQG64_09060 [Streptomyces sp. S6]|nr:hypothetical protein EQG64_09060 [Streptomyces sp. S6]